MSIYVQGRLTPLLPISDDPIATYVTAIRILILLLLYQLNP